MPTCLLTREDMMVCFSDLIAAFKSGEKFSTDHAKGCGMRLLGGLSIMAGDWMDPDHRPIIGADAVDVQFSQQVEDCCRELLVVAGENIPAYENGPQGLGNGILLKLLIPILLKWLEEYLT